MIIRIIGILLLSVIAYEDFKYRSIHWFLLLFLLITEIFTAKILMSQRIYEVLINLSIVGIQFIAAFIYVKITKKSNSTFINNYCGLGDILFLCIITISFSVLNFIYFMVLSNITILVLFIAYKFVQDKNKNFSAKTIPYAGLLAILFLVIKIIDMMGVYDITNDSRIIFLIMN